MYIAFLEKELSTEEERELEQLFKELRFSDRKPEFTFAGSAGRALYFVPNTPYTRTSSLNSRHVYNLCQESGYAVKRVLYIPSGGVDMFP